MTTFALIHGAWHGAWCWSLLEPELQARGHATISMDLPAEDPTASLSTYAQVVLDAIPDGAGDDIVAVGHSLGALVVPLVAAARPVATQVFLCGIAPNLHGSPWADAPPMAAPDIHLPEIHDDGSSSWTDLTSATAAFYGDCPPDVAAWAFDHLRRQHMAGLGGPYPLDALPGGRCAAIVGADDPIVTPEFSRTMCRQRLGGIEPTVLPGGHSPFLARPAALADVLVGYVD